METNDRIARSVLAAGVLTAMASSQVAKVDDLHKPHIIKNIKAWVDELEEALFPEEPSDDE